jgi:ABC-type antimicrobial peptide transport system permease subunit
MLIFGLFGVLAIGIAATGLYGLLAQQVEQGRHEIGVRMALGADAWQIVRLVTKRAAFYLSLGLAIGFAGAWNLGRLAEAFLFQVAPRDGVVYAAAGFILFAAGLCATIIPARRAARIDPLVTLKAG